MYEDTSRFPFKLFVISLSVSFLLLASWVAYSFFPSLKAWLQDSSNDQSAISATTSGYVYYSGFKNDAGFDTYVMDMRTGETKQITTTGNNWAFAPIDSAHALFSTSATGSSEDPNQIVVADFAHDSYLNIETPVGYYKRDLSSFVKEKDAVVYAARVSALTGTDNMYDPAAWNVVYGEPETQTFAVIEEAFSPVVLPDRTEILYLKADGVYVLNYRNNETYRIDSGLSDFDAGADFAIAPDQRSIVITSPIDNSFFLLTVDNADQFTVQNIQQVTVPLYYYSTPVFSPDSQSYALVRNSIDTSVTDSAIEVYAIATNEIISTQPLIGLNPVTTELHYWGTENILEKAQEHHSDGHSH